MKISKRQKKADMEWPDQPIAHYWKDEGGPYGRRTTRTVVRTILAESGEKILEDKEFVGNGLVNLRAQLDKYLTTLILYAFYDVEKTIDISFVDELRKVDSKQKNSYIRVRPGRRMVEVNVENITQKFTIEGSESAKNIARRAVERLFQSLMPVSGE